MYNNCETKTIDISVKTNYNQRRRYKLQKFKYNNYNNSNIKEYITNETNSLNKKNSWTSMIARTSKEGQNEIISNSKTYQSTLMPSKDYNHNYKNKNVYNDVEFINYNIKNKTPIKSLSDDFKKNKYKFTDENLYYQKPYNYSKLFKSVYDYNSNISYEQHYDPITQGYNINSFPTKQRYYGSYKKWVQDHDIFNTKFYNKYKYLYDNLS